MKNFTVECDVCGQRYENHAGSTPCCGSIAYKISKEGQRTNTVILNAVVTVKNKKDAN